MSSPKRLQVKLFFDDSVKTEIKSFIPVFHKWIQKQETGDLLIDVHNYSHMHHGPGILLVAHEGDFAIDLADGRIGLIYRRKREFSGAIRDQLTLALQRAVSGALRLEDDKSLEENPVFLTNEVEIRLLDRLNYPNKTEVYESVEQDLRETVEELFGSGTVSLEQVENDPRDPLTVRVQIRKAPTLKELEGRIQLPEEAVAKG
ncbi:MAG: hypothetical protein WD355_09210 [Balneolaceae bacterium]